MTHLGPETLGALLDARLDAPARAAAEAHLAGCAECRGRLAELAAQDAALARALAHDPGDEYFATFADRVARRIVRAASRSAGGAAAPSGWRGWRAPRRLAWVGSAVAVLIVAGIVAIQPGPPVRLPASGSAVRAPAPFAPPPPASGTAPQAAKDEGAVRKSSEALRGAAGALRARLGGAVSTVGGAAGRPEPLGVPGEPARTLQQNEATSPVAQAPPPEAPSAPMAKALRREAAGASPSRAMINEQRPGREEGPPPPATTAAPPSADQKTMTGLQELERRQAVPLGKAMKPAASAFAPAPADRASDSLGMRLDVARDAAVAGGGAPDTLWSARALPFARVADSVTARSRRIRSAIGLDVATGDWSRLALLVTPGSPAQSEARFRAAETAHEAWTIAPTAARRAAARAAVDRALAAPLTAPRRAVMLAWRSRLR